MAFCETVTTRFGCKTKERKIARAKNKVQDVTSRLIASINNAQFNRLIFRNFSFATAIFMGEHPQLLFSISLLSFSLICRDIY